MFGRTVEGIAERRMTMNKIIRRKKREIERDQLKPIAINLLYFKSSGKFYTECWFDMAFDPDNPHMFQVIDRIKNMFQNGDYPGLASSKNDFIVYVNSPDYEYNVPSIIIQ